MTPAPLQIERGRVYVTPSGRRCMWQQPRPSDEPARELTFLYLGTERRDVFTLTPVQAQRMLKLEGRA